MQTVRRLYLYAMSGITLGVMLVGLNNLFVVLFHAAGLGRATAASTADDREALSLAFALIVVGAVVWTIHWLLIERSLRPANPAAQEERRSPIRAGYLSVVLAVTLVFGVLAGIQLLEHVSRRLLGVPLSNGFDFLEIDLGAAAASVLVMGAAWAYHVLIRRRDLGAVEMSGAAAWLPRVYLYGAALVGLVLAAMNLGTLVRLVLAWVVGSPLDDDVFDRSFEQRAMADALAGVIGWAIIWAGHWWYATALSHDAGWRGQSEQRSRLRAAYLLVVIGAAAVATVVFVGQAASSALQLLLGARAEFGSETRLEAIVGPLLAVVPWLLAWWAHLGWLRREATASDAESRTASVDRLSSATVALVGLAGSGIGLGVVAGYVVDLLLGGNRTTGDFWQAEFLSFVAVGLVSAILWLWNWSHLQRRHAADPVGEATATTRRAYLLVAVGASLLATLASVAVLLYQLFNTVMGVPSFDDRGSATSSALGALVVAAASAAYHGLLERNDRRIREAVAGEPQAEPVAGEPGVAPGPARRVMVLTTATQADADLVVAALRATLPPGASLEEAAD
ncbi:MAG TPA: DUF5671 domain-containing protein [Candidatus Limnocylindria bacterium]|jgi:hypothetical protein